MVFTIDGMGVSEEETTLVKSGEQTTGRYMDMLRVKYYNCNKMRHLYRDYPEKKKASNSQQTT